MLSFNPTLFIELKIQTYNMHQVIRPVSCTFIPYGTVEYGTVGNKAIFTNQYRRPICSEAVTIANSKIFFECTELYRCTVPVRYRYSTLPYSFTLYRTGCKKVSSQTLNHMDVTHNRCAVPYRMVRHDTVKTNTETLPI